MPDEEFSSGVEDNIDDEVIEQTEDARTCIRISANDAVEVDQSAVNRKSSASKREQRAKSLSTIPRHFDSHECYYY